MNVEHEEAKLRAKGFDGLYHPTIDCGCLIGDLRPCGETATGCRGGVLMETATTQFCFRLSFAW